MRPVIGITPSPQQDDLSHGPFYRFAMADTYIQAVLAAGGIPVILPPQRGNAAALLDTIDGLLLSGGADLAPATFGDAEIHPQTYGVDPLRDDFEFELIAEARLRDFPLFCICRGVQVLNVAYGGTLYQHLPDQLPSPINHRQHEAGITREAFGHRVTLTPESPFAALYGTDSVGVNSYHHQAIKDVGAGLEVAAVSEDGVIEAVTAPDQTFFVGVQWHPEIMFEHHAEQLAPFRALVEHALARRLEPAIA